MRPRHALLICLVAGWVGILLASANRDGPGTASTADLPTPAGDARTTARPTADHPAGPNEPPAPPPAPERLAAYVKFAAAHDAAEAAAEKRFGRKPLPDDPAAFTIPYRAFVDGQTRRARKQLAVEFGLSESEIDRIKKDGDRSGWPRP